MRKKEAVRITKEAIENSDICKFIKAKIEETAKKGEYELSIDSDSMPKIKESEEILFHGSPLPCSIENNLVHYFGKKHLGYNTVYISKNRIVIRWRFKKWWKRW